MSSADNVSAEMAGALEETVPDQEDVNALGMKPKRPRKAPAA
jgi:hypothetical protein